MNEQLFAHRIRQALDESAEQLPYRVTQRLARSRELALSRMPAATAALQTAGDAGRRHASATIVATVAGPGSPPSDERPSLWLRIAGGLVPVVVVAVGLYGIGAWKAMQEAEETAEVDAALLTDDVPLEAYVDKGFGVFIRNNRQ